MKIIGFGPSYAVETTFGVIRGASTVAQPSVK